MASYTAPDAGGIYPAVRPQTSDEFTSRTLGPQWEWNHNPADSHWSLTERPGFLRLRALPAADLVSARDTLTQLLQAPDEQVTTRLDVGGMVDHQKAGLAMFGVQPSWVGVVQLHGLRYVEFAEAGREIFGPQLAEVGREIISPQLSEDAAPAGRRRARSVREFVILRVRVSDARVRYSYSLDDGRTFHTLGTRADMHFSWWKAARPAVFTFNTEAHAARGGTADFDWVRIRASHQSNFALKSK